jgi:hypothetical protein
VEPDALHDPVHDERGAGHVARVLEQRNGEKEKDDVGQKDEDAADTPDDAVDDEGLEDRIRARRPQPADRVADPAETALDPLHGLLGDGEGEEEDGVHGGQEDGHPEHPVDQHPVDEIGHVPASEGRGRGDLFGQAHGRAVPPLGDEDVHRIPEETLDPGDRFPGGGQNLVPEVCDPVGVDPLEEGDGEPASGRFVQIGIDHGQETVEVVDLALDVGAVVDLEVAGGGEVAPVADRVEEIADAVATPGDGLDDRRTQQLGEPFRVEGGALALGHIDHVEGDHHRQTELEQLHRQIEVPLEVGGVDDRNRHIGVLGHQDIAGDPLLDGVGREGVGPREVHDPHVDAIVMPVPLLALHGHAGVVTDVLKRPGHRVEKRGLAAVRVARERHELGLRFVDWRDDFNDVKIFRHGENSRQKKGLTAR